MILVIGSPEEYHSKHVYEKLTALGEPVRYFDTRCIPNNMPFGWSASQTSPQGYFSIDSQKIFFQEIKSIYWRWHYGIRIQPHENTQQGLYTAYMVEREITSAIDSLFTALPCLWINSLKAVEMHKNKPYQLHYMAQNGIRIPKTLITNDAEALKSFYEENNRQIIYKPVRGGAHTTRITDVDFHTERLQSLIYSPVQLQECVEGTDIRVYAFKNGYLCSAEILAGTLDFRENPHAEIKPCELPTHVQQDCFKVMDLLQLNFSGIDIRRTETGDYIFIEANPSPMFTYFEEKTGFSITDNLIAMLRQGL